MRLCASCAWLLAYAFPLAAQPAELEQSTGRIIYHEESGGLVTKIAAPKGKGSVPRARIDPKVPDPIPAAKSRKPAGIASKRKTPEPVLASPHKAEPRPGLASPEQKRPDPVLSDAERDRLAYAAKLQRHAVAKGTAVERARSLASDAGAEIVTFRDADVALALGWLWLEGKDPASASLWFGRSRTWAPDKRDAIRGVALAALAENDFSPALAAADALPASPERSQLRRDALLGLAQRHYRSERFVDAIEQFDAAAVEGELPRYARALQAWSVLALGRRQHANEMFTALYREQPDLETAQGLLATVNAGAPLDPTLAATEPLGGVLRQRRASGAFAARRFLEARELDPQAYGDVGAVTTAHAALASGRRDKSGTQGESRLQVSDATTLEGYVPLAFATSLRARVERASLDAGAGVRARVQAAQLGLRWEHTLALEASLGRAGSDGPLGARTTAALELAATPAWGQARVAIATAPVRESILSYAGLRDAASGEARGRVLRHGIEGRALWLEKAPWSVGVRGALARLEGIGVEDNRYRGAEISAGYDLGLAGFSYAAASVSASDERYEKNLSGFTAGQGGYFSPQRYRRAGLALDFMTAERRSWIVRGRASAGYVAKREDAVRSSGHDVSAQVGGSVRVAPHVHVGFALERGLSPQYRETHVLLQVRILLEPRLTVASADIPGIVR